MPEFKVRASVMLEVETTVDADTQEEAEEIVDGWDFSDFGFESKDADIEWEVT